MAGAAATTISKPEQFDSTIDEDMADAQEDFKKALKEQVQARPDQNAAIAQQTANSLGPHFSTADQSHAACLTELGRKGCRPRSRDPDHHPPPGPGAVPVSISGGKAIKKTFDEEFESAKRKSKIA